MILYRLLRRIGLLSFCFAGLLLSGCWDRNEVNDLALVMGAAVDKEDSGIRLSVQVFIPRSSGMQQMGEGGSGGGGGGGGGQTFVRSAGGVTIADAMMHLQEKFPRTIFWGHNEVFIFSSSLAKEGLREHVDFLVRHTQIRESSFLFICQDNAKQLLELTPPLERSSSEVLREEAKSKIGVKVRLVDLIRRLQGDAEAVGVPWVEELPASDDAGKSKTAPYITGTAILKRGKLVGMIDDAMTRGVLWLRNEIEQATITIRKPDGYVSLKLIKSRAMLIPRIVDGEWVVTLRVETEDDIILNGTKQSYVNPKYTRQLERDISDEIQERVELMLGQVQKQMNCDIIGIADAFHRKYPRTWRKSKDRWDEIFPEVKFRYDIRAHVRRPGMSADPAIVPERQVNK